MNDFKPGEIWIINLEPTIGSEIKKTRPCVIISRSDFNQVSETITVVPISTGKFIASIHQKISDLKEFSHAVVPQMRVVSKKRLVKKVGVVKNEELYLIKNKIKFYLEV